MKHWHSILKHQVSPALNATVASTGQVSPAAGTASEVGANLANSHATLDPVAPTSATSSAVIPPYVSAPTQFGHAPWPTQSYAPALPHAYAPVQRPPPPHGYAPAPTAPPHGYGCIHQSPQFGHNHPPSSPHCEVQAFGGDAGQHQVMVNTDQFREFQAWKLQKEARQDV